MRIIKTLGLILIIVLAILLIVPLFFSSTVVTSESIQIQASPKLVFRQVNIIRNWADWSPFEAEDPNIVSNYEGPEMGVGATHVWKSNPLGDGKMTITESNPYAHIKLGLDFYDRGTAANDWLFEESSEGVNVTWSMTFEDLGYPLGRLLGIFMPSMMKTYQVKGLNKLKEITENQQEPIHIIELEVEPFAAITIVDSVGFEQFITQFEQNFQQLFNYAHIAGVDIAGPPFAMYMNWDTTTYIHYRVGLPVYGEVLESGNISYYQHHACTALMATHYGDYDSFDEVHRSLNLFIQEQGFNYAGYPWEVYVRGPESEVDPDKWITEIYYPIK